MCIAAVLVCAFPGSADDWRRTELPRLGLSIEMPGSWVADEPAGAEGAVLSDPQGSDTVEIVAWRTTAAHPSLAAGASGHERLLAERWGYSRQASEPLRTTAGAEALLITGEVQDNGKPLGALFAVFTHGQRYYVIGVFCPQQAASKVRAGYFDRLACSLRFSGAEPAPEYVKPPEEDEPAEPEAPESPLPEPLPASEPTPVAAEPAVEQSPRAPLDVTPASTVGQPAAAGQADQRAATPGVQLSPPPTPKAEPIGAPTVQGSPRVAPGVRPTVAPAPQQAAAFSEQVALAAPRAATPLGTPAPPPQPAQPPSPFQQPAAVPDPMAGASHVFLGASGASVELPPGWGAMYLDDMVVIHAAEDAATAYVFPVTGSGTVDDVVAGWEQRAKVQFAERSRRVSGSTTVVAGTVGDRVAVLVIAPAESCRVLTGFIARAEASGRLSAQLAGTLASFQGGPWTIAPPAVQGEAWTDAEDGALGLTCPDGWELHGGVHESAGRRVIDIEGQALGDRRMRISWRQPYLPAFRQLTSLLQGLGYREGQEYRANPADDYMRVFSRGPLEGLVARYLLSLPAETAEQTKVSPAREFAPAGALAEGENPQGALVEVRLQEDGGRALRTYAIGAANLPIDGGSYRWQAGYLSWEAPEGQERTALDALSAIVRSAQLRSGWHGAITDELRLEKMTQAAAQCVERLVAMLGGSPAIYGVLTNRCEQTNGTIRAAVASGAVGIWSVERLFELDPGYWHQLLNTTRASGGATDKGGNPNG